MIKSIEITIPVLNEENTLALISRQAGCQHIYLEDNISSSIVISSQNASTLYFRNIYIDNSYTLISFLDSFHSINGPQSMSYNIVIKNRFRNFT